MRDLVTNNENGVVQIDLSAFHEDVFGPEFCKAFEGVLLELADLEDLVAVILDGTRGMPMRPIRAARPSVDSAKRVAALFGRIESFPKPVVAIISGRCANEGLELALSAHYRVCDKQTQFAFNQISLGTIPCFGGTQRLPRLTGAKTALDMLLNARSLSATTASDVGLVDYVVDGDLHEQARILVSSTIAELGPLPTRSLVSGKDDPRRYQHQMAEAKAAVAAFGLPAAEALVDCVEAAQLMPIETGLSLERSLFAQCEASSEAIALRYLMHAEQMLVTRSKSRPRNALIVGAGPTDAALCVALLDAGMGVSVLPYLETKVDGLLAKIDAIYARAVQRGKLSAEKAQTRKAHLTMASGPFDAPSETIVIDVGSSSVDQLSEVTTAETPLILTMRSGASLQELMALSDVPRILVGFQFDKSAHIAKCVELFALTEADPVALELARTFISQSGKIPVVVRHATIAATSVLRKALFDTAEMLLLNGAEPRIIDDTLVAFGFRKGPMAFRDEIGLEAGFIKDEQPATHALMNAGRTGRSEGLGCYRYAKGDPTPRSDGTILWTLSGLRDRMGIETYAFTSDEVLKLCLGTMMNAGADLLEHGIVQQASDIDLLAVHNLDFPRCKGGPMRACEDVGLFAVKLCMAEHSHRAPKLWTLAHMVDDLIKHGCGFADASQLQKVS